MWHGKCRCLQQKVRNVTETKLNTMPPNVWNTSWRNMNSTQGRNNWYASYAMVCSPPPVQGRRLWAAENILYLNPINISECWALHYIVLESLGRGRGWQVLVPFQASGIHCLSIVFGSSQLTQTLLQYIMQLMVWNNVTITVTKNATSLSRLHDDGTVPVTFKKPIASVSNCAKRIRRRQWKAPIPITREPIEKTSIDLPVTMSCEMTCTTDLPV